MTVSCRDTRERLEVTQALHVGMSGFDNFPPKLSPGAVPFVAALPGTEEEVLTLVPTTSEQTQEEKTSHRLRLGARR